MRRRLVSAPAIMSGAMSFGLSSRIATGNPPPLWTPSQLGAALVAYLDPMDGVVLNGANVAGIANKGAGGAAWDLAQATASLQPAYGAASFNGLPGFTTDGVDDFLEAAGAALVQPYTRLSLFVPISVPGGAHLINSKTTFENIALYFPADNALGMYAGAGVVAPPIGTITAGATYCVAEAYNGAASVGNINGVDAAAALSTGSLTGINIGNGQGSPFSNARYATLVIVNRLLTVSERQKLQGYMVWRRGVASIMDASFPYKLRPPYTTDP